MVISCREPSQEDRGLRMNPFNDLGDGERSLDMGHPVKIESEGNGVLPSDEFFDIESFVLEHLQGNVDDSYPEAVALQVFREAGKSDGIHLKDRSRRDHVADRAVDSDSLPEVVNGRRMKEDEVKGCHLQCLGGEDLSDSEGNVLLKSSINFDISGCSLKPFIERNDKIGELILSLELFERSFDVTDELLILLLFSGRRFFGV